MICKNCGHTISGKYCEHCGQRSDVGRINFQSVARDISEGVFQVEKGLFFTVKEMTLRPGKALQDYLDGKRRPHMKPFAYLLLLSTVYYLVALLLGQNTWIDDAVTGWMNGAIEESNDAEVPEVATWLSKNYAYFILFLIPVFSLASFLTFKGFGKNYFEHLVINTYITGHQSIIYTSFILLGYVLSNDLTEMLYSFAAIIYTFWVFWQLFSDGSRILNVLRTLSTYVIYIILTMVLALVVIWFSQGP